MERSRLLPVVVLLFIAAACGPGRQPVHELAGSVFGTTFSIKLVAPPATLDTDALATQVEAALARIDRRMSTWRVESEVSRFNAYSGIRWFPVSAELCTLVAEALACSAATDGAFDITVGPLVDLWGFGPGTAATAPPEAAVIAELRDATGYEALHADCARGALRKDIASLHIDLSAVAKGYAVDAVAELLGEQGLGDYLVEIGGEMRASGLNADGRPWAIAIEAPDRDARDVQQVIRVTDTGVATSGDYRNAFEHAGRWYSHTIDPRTGYPVDHAAASVTVLAESAARADALATALLVMGSEAGLTFAAEEGLAALFLLRDDGDIVERRSAAFPVEVTAK